MTVKRPLARVRCVLLFLAMALPAGAILACDDYVLSEEDLSKIFDDALGELKPFVTNRSVKVEPQDAACYLKMQVSAQALGGAISCALSGCSRGIADGRKLGIESFRINGCDQIFSALGLEPRTKTAYADATEKIRAHCGTDAYRITSVVPQRTAAGGSVRLVLIPAP